MKNIVKISVNLIQSVNSLFYWLSAVAILASGLILTYQVFMRYVFRIPTIWETEASIYLGIVMPTFMGAAYGLKKGAHVTIDLFTRMLPKSIQQRLDKLTFFLSFLFCVFVSCKTWNLFWQAYSRGWKTDSLWGPPLWIPYMMVFLGFALLTLQFLIHIFGLEKVKEN